MSALTFETVVLVEKSTKSKSVLFAWREDGKCFVKEIGEEDWKRYSPNDTPQATL